MQREWGGNSKGTDPKTPRGDYGGARQSHSCIATGGRHPDQETSNSTTHHGTRHAPWGQARATGPSARYGTRHQQRDQAPATGQGRDTLASTLLVFELHGPLFGLSLTHNNNDLLSLLLKGISNRRAIFSLNQGVLTLSVIKRRRTLLRLHMKRFTTRMNTFTLNILLLILNLLLRQSRRLIIFISISLRILLNRAQDNSLSLMFIFAISSISNKDHNTTTLNRPIITRGLIRGSQRPILVHSYEYRGFILLNFVQFGYFPFCHPLSRQFRP